MRVLRVSLLGVFTCMWLSACGGPPATSRPAGSSNDSPSELPAEPAQSSERPRRGETHIDELRAVHASTASIDPEERLAAIDRLDTMTPQEAAATLEVLIWDEDFEVREAALEAMLELEMSGMADAADTLALLITDADPEFRQTMVEGLIDMAGPIAVSLLHNATYDPDVRVREAAIDGLEELGVTNPAGYP